MKDSTEPGKLSEVANAALLPELRTLIVETRHSVAHNVNSALVHLYWRIGTRVYVDILSQSRAEYGKQIIAALGRQLELEFGRGFGEKNLRRMVQLAQAFPNEAIVAAWNSKRQKLESLSISPNCPLARFSRSACTKPSS